MPLPPQVALVTFYSPQKSDQGLIEIWSADVASYYPLDQGAPHPNTRDYPGFKLGKQKNLPNDHTKVIRIWVKDTTNPEWYGYSVKFVSESASHPIFIRAGDRELRNTYAPKTKGQPLKAVYKLTVTSAGTGYTPGTFPNLTFTGGGGTGAAGYGVVNPDGTIGEFILDTGGINYTSNPTFTVAAPPSGGTTATGTATIQPATALLVAEEAAEFPQDSEFYGLYFNVTRVYQTLPGPIIHGQDYNRQFSVPIPYTLQETQAGLYIGDDLKEIETIDSVRQRVKTLDVSLLQAVLDAYILPFGGVSDIPLPDVLTSISSIKNLNFSEGGGGVDSAYGQVTGDHGSFSVDVPNSNQSAAAISYELNFNIPSGRERGRNKPTLRGVVFMPDGFTQTDLTNHITALLGLSVSAWPDFRPQLESFVVKGMAVKVSTEAQAQAHYSFDSTSVASGASASHSFSHGVGITSGPVRISPTIHGSLSISGDGTSDSKTVNSSSAAGISGTVPASASSGTQSATASASVVPASLSATPGQSTYPGSGLRLLDQTGEPFMCHRNMLHFELFDFGVL